jgi:hypothetical protein
MTVQWRKHALSGAVFVALLSSMPAHESGAQNVRATVILPGFKSPVLMDSVGQVTTVAATKGAVFHALRAAFDSIGVQTTVADSANGVIGNLELKLTRRFAGESLSRWFDCGIGHTGPTANSYRVNVAMLAMVTPNGGTASSLRVAIAAGAQAFSGPLGDPIACETRGALEEKIQRIVVGAVAKAAP